MAQIENFVTSGKHYVSYIIESGSSEWVYARWPWVAGCQRAWQVVRGDVADRDWSTHSHHGILPHQIGTLLNFSAFIWVPHYWKFDITLQKLGMIRPILEISNTPFLSNALTWCCYCFKAFFCIWLFVVRLMHWQGKAFLTILLLAWWFLAGNLFFQDLAYSVYENFGNPPVIGWFGWTHGFCVIFFLEWTITCFCFFSF